MQGYTKICKDILRYAKICQRYTKVCKDIQERWVCISYYMATSAICEILAQ